MDGNLPVLGHFGSLRVILGLVVTNRYILSSRERDSNIAYFILEQAFLFRSKDKGLLFPEGERGIENNQYKILTCRIYLVFNRDTFFYTQKK